MSMKVLEMERLSPYGGSVRGTLREGSYTEDSVRHVMESGGNGAFPLQGSIW
jgi:hypothetical protein